jgi:predicted ABC-type transport system involved in lysophospholipase L1 biosynthesis ATPase subunit
MKTLSDVVGRGGLYFLAEPVGRIDMLAEALQANGRVAVLDAAACLVNNLRVWENLILPAWYCQGGVLADWEAPLAELLAQSGLAEQESERLLGSLPALLKPDERCLLVLLRAMLLRPGVILIEPDWLGWLRRQPEDHPARCLWACCESTRVVLGMQVPGAEFEMLSAEQV